MEFPFPTKLYSSPNVSSGRSSDAVLFIHSTRSGQSWSLDKEYTTTIGYMMQSGTVSSDAVVGPVEVAFMLPFADQRYTWHAGHNDPTLSMNRFSRGIEVCQPRPTGVYTEFQYKATAWLAQQYHRLFGLQLRRVMSQRQGGMIGHEDSEQGKAGGKSDPGPKWDWTKFIAYCQRDDLFAAPTPGAFNPLGFGPWLVVHPEYGLPRHDATAFPDGSGDLYLRLTATPAHPKGAYLVYRKWIHQESGNLLDAIRPVTWGLTP